MESAAQPDGAYDGSVGARRGDVFPGILCGATDGGIDLAVWKSGCAIKLSNALFHSRAKLDGQTRQAVSEMLSEAEVVLHIPEGQKTWGDRNFEFRKAEIAALTGKF